MSEAKRRWNAGHHPKVTRGAFQVSSYLQRPENKPFGLFGAIVQAVMLLLIGLYMVFPNGSLIRT